MSCRFPNYIAVFKTELSVRYISWLFCLCCRESADVPDCNVSNESVHQAVSTANAVGRNIRSGSGNPSGHTVVRSPLWSSALPRSDTLRSRALHRGEQAKPASICLPAFWRGSQDLSRCEYRRNFNIVLEYNSHNSGHYPSSCILFKAHDG
jgi:hypothetical protein